MTEITEEMRKAWRSADPEHLIMVNEIHAERLQALINAPGKDTFEGALAWVKAIRSITQADIAHRISDPGSVLPRGNDYTESISSWSARAVLDLFRGPKDQVQEKGGRPAFRPWMTFR